LPPRVKTPIPSAPSPVKDYLEEKEYEFKMKPLSYSRMSNLIPELQERQQPNLPNKFGLRKVERRISDFFSEALNMDDDRSDY
jgi:hypothetical protein